jgi:hypothetical protein
VSFKPNIAHMRVSLKGLAAAFARKLAPELYKITVTSAAGRARACIQSSRRFEINEIEIAGEIAVPE